MPGVTKSRQLEIAGRSRVSNLTHMPGTFRKFHVRKCLPSNQMPASLKPRPTEIVSAAATDVLESHTVAQGTCQDFFACEVAGREGRQKEILLRNKNFQMAHCKLRDFLHSPLKIISFWTELRAGNLI